MNKSEKLDYLFDGKTCDTCATNDFCRRRRWGVCKKWMSVEELNKQFIEQVVRVMEYDINNNGVSKEEAYRKILDQLNKNDKRRIAKKT